jgi:SMI1/KNR4 family protein SUKH-1
MDDVLDRLADFIARNPTRCCFAPGASLARIAEAEKAAGIGFPEPYQRFLARFDGGFISLHRQTSDPDWDHASSEWNSNALFGTARLVDEHLDLRGRWLLDIGWEGEWPYLPFCHTDGQELLVFGPAGPDGARPVRDAWHEVWPHEWHVVYPDFRAFLAAYLETEGRIETIGSSGGPG